MNWLLAGHVVLAFLLQGQRRRIKRSHRIADLHRTLSVALLRSTHVNMKLLVSFPIRLQSIKNHSKEYYS